MKITLGTIGLSLFSVETYTMEKTSEVSLSLPEGERVRVRGSVETDHFQSGLGNCVSPSPRPSPPPRGRGSSPVAAWVLRPPRIAKNRKLFPGSVAVGLFLIGWAAAAGELKIELPVETGVFKQGTGAEIANGQCLVCHSVEYVATQPLLPRTFWATSVKKMREKYGAQIPEEQVEPLLDYLTRHYGAEGTNTAARVPPNAPPKGSPATAAAPTAEALAMRLGCLGCHHSSVKIVGPSYKEIAAKYRNDTQGTQKVSEQIHKGGSGKWGYVIMPPFPQVSPEETKVLAEWILGQNGK